MLKELNIPVCFETENLDASKMESEFILALLGASSRAESESINSRIKWGVRAGFQKGHVRYYYKNWLGYQCGMDGTPEIISDEAAVVRRICSEYLTGSSLREIKNSLESDGVFFKGQQAE